MFLNQLKLAFRHITKNKTSSFINIIGLAVGMAVVMLISLWMWDELSYNNIHPNRHKIARVMQNQLFGDEIQTWRTQAMQLAPVLREEYGDYFDHVILSSFPQNRTVSVDAQPFIQKGIFMEPNPAQMLSLNMLKGTGNTLTDPNTILLNEAMAQLLFGEENPIGKALRMGDNYELEVAGVYETLPSNSSFSDIQFIASWELYKTELPTWVDWGNSWFQVFVQVTDRLNVKEVSEQIELVKYHHVDEEEQRFDPALFLHPMTKWRLYDKFENGVNAGGNILYVRLFGIIGIFVLILACINFMNLSTARSERRSKEVGIRKTIGSTKRQLIFQFLGESILVAIIAFCLALNIAQLCLPLFNDIAGKELNLLWDQSWFWFMGIGATIIVGLIAGSYPALFLSSFDPAKALKGNIAFGQLATTPRKMLVVLQFTVSVSLIIGIIIVFQQIQHAKSRPIGYNYSSLISIPIRNPEIHNDFSVLRNELLQSGFVYELAKSESPITETYITNSGLDWEGKDPFMQDQFTTLRVSHEFGKTIGWNIVEGRDFSRSYSTDSAAFVINEAAASYLGFENPIGKQIKWGDNEVFTIIGVVSNLVTQSPFASVGPMLFFIDYERTNFINIKFRPEVQLQEAISSVETIFQSYDPQNPFSYEFVDEDYAQKFGEEERIGKLASIFAFLAIFISCLGLFGLTAFITERRTKEIGIRKVLGATITQIVQLLSKDFIFLVIVALLFAIPISWYIMEKWLESYPYRIEIQWWVFLFAGLSAVVIAFLTISYQSIKAALANPVDSLRNE